MDIPRFRNVADEVGLSHVYLNGASPKALMVESTGGGCGWIDYDRDGLCDLYLTQGGIPDAPAGTQRPADALFRNSGRHFRRVEPSARINERGYGQGVAVGDFNDDGFDDIFVCNVGRNSLYENLGDGTFVDVTSVLEGSTDVWSTSAAWGDTDRDGDLDLYVCNYAIYDPYDPVPCLDTKGIPSICHPRNVDAEPDCFFANGGDDRFREVAHELGLFGPGNKALGVVIADLTGDDWPDIFVANDTTANFLFVNGRDGRFRESSILLGGAYSASGQTQASMGIALGDYDHNGFPDLFLTHFTGEHDTLYKNLGPQGLHDVSGLTGLRLPTLPKLGFGTVMADFNQDGQMDLFVTNGHIDPRYEDSEGYDMSPQLFSFDGARWTLGSDRAGDFFLGEYVGRGVATADFDGDRDLDLAVVHQNSPVALLQNESAMGHGIRVCFVGRGSNRRGVGTRVRVRYGEQEQVQELAGGTSYAAAHEPMLLFGLGESNDSCEIQVDWPSGVSSTFVLDRPDCEVIVVEGRDEPYLKY